MLKAQAQGRTHSTGFRVQIHSTQKHAIRERRRKGVECHCYMHAEHGKPGLTPPNKTLEKPPHRKKTTNTILQHAAYVVSSFHALRMPGAPYFF